ncbi:MAG: helix-turn-helix domain-containing protein [Bacillota bacterium]
MTIKDLEEGINALKPIYGKEITIQNCKIQLIHINYMKYKPAWTTSPHSHSWYELHYINQGKARTMLESKKLTINPEYYYIIPPDTTHRHLPTDHNNGHEGFALRWQIFLKENQSPSNSIHFSSFEEGLRDKKIRKGKNLKNNIKYLFELKKTCNPSQISLLSFIGTIIFELSNNENIVKWNDLSNIACSISYQAKIFIEDNFSQKINMKNLANLLGVSYPYLSRVFKNDIDKTLVTYLQEIRIKETKKLLGNTCFTLKEIADKVGFKNQYYLSRVFKKHTGVPPTMFRKEITDI